jgi:hypothetical protein
MKVFGKGSENPFFQKRFSEKFKKNLPKIPQTIGRKGE